MQNCYLQTLTSHLHNILKFPSCAINRRVFHGSLLSDEGFYVLQYKRSRGMYASILDDIIMGLFVGNDHILSGRLKFVVQRSENIPEKERTKIS